MRVKLINRLSFKMSPDSKISMEKILKFIEKDSESVIIEFAVSQDQECSKLDGIRCGVETLQSWINCLSYDYKLFLQKNQDSNPEIFYSSNDIGFHLVKRLSATFRDVEITHSWTDKVLGIMCGSVTYLNEECIFKNVPVPTMPDAIELSAEILHYNLRDCGMYLNATETEYLNLKNDKEAYEIVELFSKAMLFSNERIDSDQIPKGTFCYHLRYDDNGNFDTIEPWVGVDHAGSIITKYPIDFSEKGYIELSEDTSPNFISDEISMLDYINGKGDSILADISE